VHETILAGLGEPTNEESEPSTSHPGHSLPFADPSPIRDRLTRRVCEATIHLPMIRVNRYVSGNVLGDGKSSMQSSIAALRHSPPRVQPDHGEPAVDQGWRWACLAHNRTLAGLTGSQVV